MGSFTLADILLYAIFTLIGLVGYAVMVVCGFNVFLFSGSTLTIITMLASAITQWKSKRGRGERMYG